MMRQVSPVAAKGCQDSGKFPGSGFRTWAHHRRRLKGNGEAKVWCTGPSPSPSLELTWRRLLRDLQCLVGCDVMAQQAGNLRWPTQEQGGDAVWKGGGGGGVVAWWRGGVVAWWRGGGGGVVAWWRGGVVAWWRGGVVAWWRGCVVAWWRGGVVAWWRGGVVAWWRGGVVAWWRGGVVAWWRWWRGGVVAWWRGGVVAWWRGGVVAWWRGGVVEWWEGRECKGGSAKGKGGSRGHSSCPLWRCRPPPPQPAEGPYERSTHLQLCLRIPGTPPPPPHPKHAPHPPTAEPPTAEHSERQNNREAQYLGAHHFTQRKSLTGHPPMAEPCWAKHSRAVKSAAQESEQCMSRPLLQQPEGKVGHRRSPQGLAGGCESRGSLQLLPGWHRWAHGPDKKRTLFGATQKNKDWG